MVTGLRSTMEEHEERFLQENDCHDYDHDDGEDEPGCEPDNYSPMMKDQRPDDEEDVVEDHVLPGAAVGRFPAPIQSATLGFS